MHPCLDELITRFRNAQDAAVAILVGRLNISLPASNRDWASTALHKRQSFDVNGTTIGLEPHGYGVKITAPTLTIDFDWGEHGEPDGFDAWRLWVYRRDNLPELDVSHEQIRSWLNEALHNEELIKIGTLYFDPLRRAN